MKLQLETIQYNNDMILQQYKNINDTVALPLKQELHDLKNEIMILMKNDSADRERIDQLQDKINELEEEISKISRKTEELEKIFEYVKDYENLSQYVTELSDRLDNQQKNFLRIEMILDDIQEKNILLQDLENEINNLRKEISSKSTQSASKPSKETLKLKKLEKEMRIMKTELAEHKQAIERLEPIALVMQTNIETLEDIKGDPYKNAFYHKFVQQLNAAYLASSVVQTNIVKSSSTGTLGKVAKIVTFVGKYIPMVVFVE